MTRPVSSLLTAFGVLASPDRAAALAPNSFLAPSWLSSRRASTFARPPLPSPSSSRAPPRRGARRLSARVAFAGEETRDGPSAFDPLGCGDGWDEASPGRHRCLVRTPPSSSASASAPASAVIAAAPAALVLSSWAMGPASASAATPISQGAFDPAAFKPVCSASDGFYRFLQGATRAAVGDDGFSEYGPLIAGGLLRIRLELCVVESFFNEAVGPFIQQNGVSWILPLHETVETFLAGTIFALATTFILVGSTKLIQILAFYGDLIVGGPCRLFGGFFFDRARGEPVTLDISFFGLFKTRLVGPPVDFKEEEVRKALEKASGEAKLIDFDKVQPAGVPVLVLSGAVKVVGDASKIFREFIEALDLFVGRYLVLIASGYILLKFVHFKIFPDFP